MAPEGVGRRDLPVLYLSMIVTRVGFGVIIIIFPSYIFRSSDIAVAFALALYPIFEAFASVPMGRFCDTVGRKRVFVVALAVMATLTASIGLTRDIYLISALHALMGICAAGITIASLTMITDLTSVRNRGVGMGAFDFANIGGYAVGVLGGGALHSIFQADLGFAFLVTGGAIASAFVFALVTLREPPHEREAGKLEFNPFRALDSHTRAILPIWLSLTALIGIVFFLPRALTVLGISSGTTANLLFLGIAALGVGSIGFGALSDRIGREKVMVIGVFGLFGLLITLSYAVGNGLSQDRLLGSLPLIAPFALATAALVPSILATVGDRARETRRGSAMGLYGVMLSGGIAFGTLVAGLAHAVGGLPGILYSGAVVFLAASILSLFLLRRSNSSTGLKIAKDVPN